MSRPEQPPLRIKDLLSLRRNRRPKENRVIEPIAPIDVVIAERPWDARGLSLREQLTTNVAEPGAEKPKLLGEGLLMRADTDQLRNIFSAIVKEQGGRAEKPWSKAEQQLILDVAEYVAIVHEGQLRKDKFTPYEHHLLRIASRAAQLDIANPYMVAVALLHDAPEDHGITLDDMVRHFVDKKKYDSLAIFNTLNILFEGANALNNQRDGKRLSSRQYYNNINTANDQFPDLHLWVIKGLDRLDSFNSDLSATLRHQELDENAEVKRSDIGRIRRLDADRIKKTAEKKIFPVRRIIKAHDQGTGIIDELDEAVELTRRLIVPHGLKLRRGIVEGAIYRAEQVRRRSTGRGQE